MGVEHGILLMILGIITSIAVMYVILMVMSNEGLDDKDSNDTI